MLIRGIVQLTGLDALACSDRICNFAACGSMTGANASLATTEVSEAYTVS